MSHHHFIHPRDQASALAILWLLIAATWIGAAREKTQVVVPTRIELNTAGVEELRTLPEIGMRRAQKICQQRRQRGFYRTAEEAARSLGIGPHAWAQVAPYLQVEEKP